MLDLTLPILTLYYLKVLLADSLEDPVFVCPKFWGGTGWRPASTESAEIYCFVVSLTSSDPLWLKARIPTDFLRLWLLNGLIAINQLARVVVVSNLVLKIPENTTGSHYLCLAIWPYGALWIASTGLLEHILAIY